MSAPKYLEAARGVLDYLESTQMTAIEQASDLIATALSNGGAVRCAEIGHGLQGDFFNRAGGLAAVQLFTYRFEIDSPLPECLLDRLHSQSVDKEIETVRFALRNSNLRAGDVMLVSSVSGRGKIPIELALASRDMGIKVIGFTSTEYSAKITSAHPSMKKLPEVVDVTVDIGAPYGDAAVEIAGFDYPVLPVSGIGMICAGWMIWERVMERMVAAGAPPSVFISANRPEGPEHYLRARRKYNDQGF